MKGLRPGLVLALGALVAAPAAAAELPLPPGFYVRAEAACGEASVATIVILHPGGLQGLRDACAFGEVREEAAGRYAVEQSCGPVDDPAAAEAETVVYEVLGDSAFRVTSPHGWSYESRLCAQGELPAPFNEVDLDAFLNG